MRVVEVSVVGEIGNEGRKFFMAVGRRKLAFAAGACAVVVAMEPRGSLETVMGRVKVKNGEERGLYVDGAGAVKCHCLAHTQRQCRNAMQRA
jgi:hypothetical protein